MILSQTDAERFYHIWWPLLKYVNDRENLVVDFPENPVKNGIGMEDGFKIRNALWSSPEFLSGFVEANPAGLTEEDLALAASWERRISGEFIIMKYLKKHSIFLLNSNNPIAFGVLGLMSPLDEVLPYSPPVMVKAVLLPFEGKITYDGLVSPYSIYFGGSIRRDFSQSLRTAMELNGLIVSLEPEDEKEAKTDAIIDGNRKILGEFRKDLIKAGLSEKMVNEHFSVVESFVKSCLLKQIPPVSLLHISEDDVNRYFSQYGEKANRVSFKRLVKFLLNSGRIDWDTAQAMEDFLKNRK
jgi:hypothetical protein